MSQDIRDQLQRELLNAPSKEAVELIEEKLRVLDGDRTT